MYFYDASENTHAVLDSDDSYLATVAPIIARRSIPYVVGASVALGALRLLGRRGK